MASQSYTAGENSSAGLTRSSVVTLILSDDLAFDYQNSSVFFVRPVINLIAPTLVLMPYSNIAATLMQEISRFDSHSMFCS